MRGGSRSPNRVRADAGRHEARHFRDARERARVPANLHDDLAVVHVQRTVAATAAAGGGRRALKSIEVRAEQLPQVGHPRSLPRDGGYCGIDSGTIDAGKDTGADTGSDTGAVTDAAAVDANDAGQVIVDAAVEGG